MQLTRRQAEVMANLSRVTTDGSRHEPQFRLGEKNVSVQIRSLLNYRLIEWSDNALVPVDRAAAKRQPAPSDVAAAVRAMRHLLSHPAEP